VTLVLEPGHCIDLEPGRRLLLDVGGVVPAERTSQVEINATCVTVSTDGRAIYSVYGHSLRTPDYSVKYIGYRHPRVNAGPNKGESFELDLGAVPGNIAAIYVMLSAYPVAHFDFAGRAYVDFHYGTEEQATHFGHYELPVETGSQGVLLARIVRNGAGWQLQVLGLPFKIESENELAAQAASHFAPPAGS